MKLAWLFGVLVVSSYLFLAIPVSGVHLDGMMETSDSPAPNETPSYLLQRKPMSAEKIRKRKIPKIVRCCHLGREMAKIGESCTYSTSLASISPNTKHYHKMKTKIWISAEERPVKPGLLRKCKRYKVFYEKCCRDEEERIDRDLRKMLERLQKIFEMDLKPKKNKRRGRKGRNKKKRLRSGKLKTSKTKRKSRANDVASMLRTERD